MLKREYNQFMTSIRYYKELNCIYINIPKAGCSSIKKGIINKHSSPQVMLLHRQNTTYTLAEMDNEFSNAFKFTFVRNPYKRIISAYNDKILKRRDNIWFAFAAQYKLDIDSHLSFEDFLLLLEGEDFRKMDAHFVPQSYLMCKSFIAYDFIGHLETIKEDVAFVSDFLVLPDKKYNPSQGISAKDLSSKEIEIILNIYKDDFALLGYDEDVNMLMPNKENLSPLFFEKKEEKTKRLQKITAHAKKPKFLRSFMHRLF